MRENLETKVLPYNLMLLFHARTRHLRFSRTEPVEISHRHDVRRLPGVPISEMCHSMRDYHPGIRRR
jgi:hypothetical protein